MRAERTLAAAADGELPDAAGALALADFPDTRALAEVASMLRDREFLNVVTYSRKVFIPLTHLCRDVCHYCTFAQTPSRLDAPFMSLDRVLEVARHGAALGCKEALFTLGEKPELRYRAAREALAQMGYETTVAYLRDAAAAVLEETGLLPHLNPGNMTPEEIALLRPVSPSMGIMLESASDRLTERGMPHYGSPDKVPAVRLRTLRDGGAAGVPFTTGILIGIGETRRERIESLLAIRDAHEQHGHIQEVIVQNFRAKPDTKMRHAPEPSLDELLWTIAVARIIFGASMSIQAPPNLSPGVLQQIVAAGINDWGGVSPLTPDFVNPEAPWPHVEELARETEAAGKHLHERLTIYPAYASEPDQWLDPGLKRRVLDMIDGEGLPRIDGWSPGAIDAPPSATLESIYTPPRERDVSPDLRGILAHASNGDELEEDETGAPDSRARRRLQRGRAGGGQAARRSQRRRCQLRGQPQYQLHQHLLLQVPLLRLLQGQAGREPARAPVRPRPRGDPAPRARSVGPGRHGGLPARRHPPRVHGPDVRGNRPRREGSGAFNARACILAAGSVARRRHIECQCEGASRGAAGRRTRYAARYRGGDPRRRGARRDLPGQDQYRAVA